MHKAQYYVYELCDPRTMKPFYIGKGKGKRMYEHDKETRKGVCSEKTNYIKELDEMGLSSVKRKIASFWEEKDAFAYERDLIKKTVGLTNKSNNRRIYKKPATFTYEDAIRMVKQMKRWFATQAYAKAGYGVFVVSSTNNRAPKFANAIGKMFTETIYPMVITKLKENPNWEADFRAALR